MADKEKFIKNNLACPCCLANLNFKSKKCAACGYGFDFRNNVPIFIRKGSGYIDRLSEENPTNPYSPKSLKVIKENQNALILDFGAGNPAQHELFDNVIRMEFVHYKSTDIVSTEKRIPFKDESFDYVISESVFEHVSDPFFYAKEIKRVLKPGGITIIDTAFLQPVHADPHHYFNMTLDGLRKVFSEFKEISSGVENYQTASYTMNILKNTYLSLIENRQAKEELTNRLADIDFIKYDQFISSEKQRIMSAGVYFVGKKV